MNGRRLGHAHKKSGDAPVKEADAVPVSHRTDGGSRADLLDYMSDLVGELKSLSDQNAFSTLSALLALAHAEAIARRNEIRQQSPRSAGL